MDTSILVNYHLSNVFISRTEVCMSCVLVEVGSGGEGKSAINATVPLILELGLPIWWEKKRDNIIPITSIDPSVHGKTY